MKKFLSLFLFLALLLLIPWAHTLSANFDQAFQEYLSSFKNYQQLHQEYSESRNAYLTYQTQIAKNEALISTQKMLKARNEVLNYYLEALVRRLNENEGVEIEKRNLAINKANELSAWLADHSNRISAAATLEDIVSTSDQAKPKYFQIEILGYQSLVLNSSGLIRSLQEQTKNQLLAVENKVLEIKNNGDKDVSTLERWLLEADYKITLSQEKQQEAENLINESKVSQENVTNTYNQSINLQKEALQYLKETVSILKEVLSEVKIAD